MHIPVILRIIVMLCISVYISVHAMPCNMVGLKVNSSDYLIDTVKMTPMSKMLILVFETSQFVVKKSTTTANSLAFISVNIFGLSESHHCFPFSLLCIPTNVVKN